MSIPAGSVNPLERTASSSHSDSHSVGLNEKTDPLTQHFSYANNVTICDDGTLCPNPNNETCCKKHQGRTELNYHNRARLPESVTGLASYYAQAGYTIPGASATPSVELHAARSSPVPTSAAHSSSPPSSTGSGNASSTPASPAAKQSLNPLPSSSGLSAGAKAGMGVGIGVAAMICATVAFIFYLRRRKHQKSEALHGSNGDAYSPDYKDQYQPPAPMYYSPELAADTAKYEVDASPESQPNSPHEVPGSIPVKRP